MAISEKPFVLLTLVYKDRPVTFTIRNAGPKKIRVNCWPLQCPESIELFFPCEDQFQFLIRRLAWESLHNSGRYDCQELWDKMSYSMRQVLICLANLN